MSHSQQHQSVSSGKQSIFKFLPESWRPARELVRFLAPYKHRLTLGLLAGVGYAATNGCIPLVIQRIGDTAFH